MGMLFDVFGIWLIVIKSYKVWLYCMLCFVKIFVKKKPVQAPWWDWCVAALGEADAVRQMRASDSTEASYQLCQIELIKQVELFMVDSCLSMPEPEVS